MSSQPVTVASNAHFSYDAAFARNLGWVTEPEQRALRAKRVAIAGLGGVGGVHLLSLARLGIGSFSLSDFDTFDIANFNRQAGAGVSTLGRRKIDVMARQALDINPELDLRLFDTGVDESNLEAFLADVDLYVDALDYFAFDARRATFAACARLGIPAITAAPLGMGTAFLAFMPGGMSFDEYFDLRDGQSDAEQALRFLVGLAPAALHRAYLVEPWRVDFVGRRGPSTIIACQLCAGVIAAEALKILLARGTVRPAPWGYQFDAYRNRLRRTWRPGGNRHPLQRLVMSVARRQFMKATAAR